MASSIMESLTVKKVSVGTKDFATVFAFMETLSGVESKIRLFFRMSTPHIHYSHRAFLLRGVSDGPRDKHSEKRLCRNRCI